MNNKIEIKNQFVDNLSLILNNSLIDEITDILNSVEEGKKVYQNFADFFRSALRDYINGEFKMSSEKRRTGIKRTTSLRVDQNILNFYNSIPKGKRSDWLERILEAYMKEKLY